MRFACVLAISGCMAQNYPRPRRLNTELVQFMDEELYETFDKHGAMVRSLATQDPETEEQDGLGGMRNFSAEKGYKNSGNAAEVIKEEHLGDFRAIKNLPFTLEDLKQPSEIKQQTVDELEKEGKGYIEREDGINEVTVVQLDSGIRGINVDALLQSRQDLR